MSRGSKVKPKPAPKEPKSRLVLVPIRLAYPEYVSWWEQRGWRDRAPAPSNFGIFVAHPDYGLITGAMIYVTDGPVMFLEHFSVNPSLRRLWLPAATRTLREYRTLSAVLGKWPVICPDRKRFAKVCAENGFVQTGAIVMAGAPPT